MKPFDICFIIIIVIIIVILIALFIKRFLVRNKIDRLEKNLQGSQSPQSPQGPQDLENGNTNYLMMTENDFDKLEIPERWKYRTQCLAHFPSFKTDYTPKKYKYPLMRAMRNGLIFVNLASYRDPECPKTIYSLFSNSTNWKNLRICVCQQNASEDLDCLYKLPSQFAQLVKVIRLDYTQARGPTVARFLIQQQYEGEEYYMQIDSHTIVEKDWDSKLINTLQNLPSRSCLTQYLPDYQIGQLSTVPKVRGALTVSQICSLDGFTRINAPYLNVKNLPTRPFHSNGWSGCFSFSSGDICVDAPIDPYTPDVFFGEEMDIALRLYTRGWNFYAPNYPIAYTNFNRNYRETFWEKKGKGYNKNITLCSRLRIHYRLGTLPQQYAKLLEENYPELLVESNKYSLGNVRTLRDYENLIEFKFEFEK